MLRPIAVTRIQKLHKLLSHESLKAASPKLLVRAVGSTRALRQNSPSMELQRIVSQLHEMFPLCLAEDWDNVGLLVEPSSPQQPVRHIYLTNDLTEEVMEEIENAVPKAGLIVAYHPPIFKPIETLTRKGVKERIILKAVESKMAIYSPHTAADSVFGGVNDWLARGLGDGEVRPLKPATLQYVVKASLLTDKQYELLRDNLTCCGVKIQKNLRDDSFFDITVQCKLSSLAQVYTLVCGQLHNVPVSVLPSAQNRDDIDCMKHSGVGRKLTLSSSVSLIDLVQRIKQHLGLSSVRLAIGRGCEDTTVVNTIAICAGSGAAVLHGVTADVFLTGEMSHHEVLDATSRGTSVILCEHSNTERGYLTVMKQNLQQALGKEVKISISEVDRDPLVTV